jgi:hypothetical protein
MPLALLALCSAALGTNLARAQFATFADAASNCSGPTLKLHSHKGQNMQKSEQQGAKADERSALPPDESVDARREIEHSIRLDLTKTQRRYQPT